MSPPAGWRGALRTHPALLAAIVKLGMSLSGGQARRTAQRRRLVEEMEGGNIAPRQRRRRACADHRRGRRRAWKVHGVHRHQLQRTPLFMRVMRVVVMEGGCVHCGKQPHCGEKQQQVSRTAPLHAIALLQTHVIPSNTLARSARRVKQSGLSGTMRETSPGGGSPWT